MEFQKDNVNFNFMVSDIDFVLYRTPNNKWKIDNLSNQNYYILAFAFDGSAVYKIDGNTIDIKKGDLLFFQKDKLHSAYSKSDDPWSHSSIAFDLVCFSDDSKLDIQKLPTITQVKLFSEYAAVFKQINEIWNARSTGYLIKCRSLISEIMYLLISETQTPKHTLSHSETLEKIKIYLIENYAKTFQIKELAALADMSPSHFRLLFKSYTGQTVTQFQNRLKINKACDLLRSRACNITETAYNVGFNDIYYFSRLFKKMTGVTPSAFIKNL